MTTLSWQPARHSWGADSVSANESLYTCRICGARKRLIRIPSRKLYGRSYSQAGVSIRLATAEEPDVWLPPAKVRCIHRGLRVLP